MSIVEPGESLSHLIGEIYDAALDPTLWPHVLPKAAGYVGGQAAGLLAKNSLTNAPTAFFHVGLDPEYMRRYLDEYWRYDPCGAIEMFSFAIEQPISTIDLMPYDEFREGRFFREWAAPQGWVDSVSVVLERSSTAFAFFSVLRDRATGLADERARRRIRVLAPHIRRAVLIGSVIDLGKVEAATFATALEGLSAAIFFVDAEGRVLHANAAGKAMIAAGQPFRSGEQLAAIDVKANPELQEALARTAVGDSAIGAQGIALPLNGGGERHVAHILPLTAGARRQTGVSHPATAAVFVHKEALRRPSAPEIIAKAYHLTPTELRVLLAIVEVGGVPDVAAALGIGKTTVKTHLDRLYEKTGARRQADLVKIVAGFASPLAG